MINVRKLFFSILHTEVVGFLFIVLNKVLTNANSYLPESFIQDKTKFQAFGLVVILLIVLGVIQYYSIILYDKLNWRIASLLNYILEVSAILLILFYLEFINNIVNLLVVYVVTSFLFILKWLYYYRKFS
ncbi:hypothetical protein ACWOBA_08875 [Gemella taiwanensis]